MATLVRDKNTAFKPRTYRPRLGDRISFGGVIYIVSANIDKPFEPKPSKKASLDVIDAEIDALDYNTETKEAMKESVRVARDPDAPTYYDMESLHAALGI